MQLKGSKWIQDLCFGSFFTNKTMNHFSVQGKMTYGYNYGGDNYHPIFIKLKRFNNKQSIENMKEYLPLKMFQIEIPVEDPLIRQFNFFEVIAHCLHVEMEKKIKDNSQSLNKKLFFLYDRVQEIVKTLIVDDLSLSSQKKNIAYCEKQIIRKQILRRFYQMCKNYGNSKQLSKIIKLMDQQSHKIAIQIRDYIKIPQKINRQSKDQNIKKLQFPLLQIINQIIEKYSPTKEKYQKLQQKQDKFHYSVGNKFRAMFSTNIQQQYFSQINKMQDRFIESNVDFGQDKKNYSTLSFIPTSTTSFLFKNINSHKKCLFFSGQRKLGKSFSLFLLWELQNEINDNKILYIPNINQFDLLSKKLWPLIIDTYWRDIPPNQFQTMQNQIKSKIKVNTNEQNYKMFSTIIEWLSRFEITKIIFDQFSSLISTFHKQRVKEYATKKDIEQAQAFQQFFYNYQKINMSVQLIFCSSICVEKQEIKQQLGMKNFSEEYYQIYNHFSNQQAYYLIKIWVIKELNRQLYAQINQNKLIQLKLNLNETIKKIDVEIEKLKYFYMNQYPTKKLEGTMQFLKQPARLIFIKIINQIFNLSQKKTKQIGKNNLRKLQFNTINLKLKNGFKKVDQVKMMDQNLKNIKSCNKNQNNFEEDTSLRYYDQLIADKFKVSSNILNFTNHLFYAQNKGSSGVLQCLLENFYFKVQSFFCFKMIKID